MHKDKFDCIILDEGDLSYYRDAWTGVWCVSKFRDKDKKEWLYSRDLSETEMLKEVKKSCSFPDDYMDERINAVLDRTKHIKSLMANKS